MFQFEPTTDLSLIREILTHPAIWDEITDDFSGAAKDFQPINHPQIWHLLAKDGEEILGLWRLTPANGICWEIHTCLLPNCRGKRAVQAGRECARWIWENTCCWRIFTNVPEHNKPALWFAKACGMEEFGRNRKSYMKRGVLEDLILLGISRPEVSECPQP